MSGLVRLPYPKTAADRDRWITAKRPPRNQVDSQVPYAFLVEQERVPDGSVVPVATIFLTNRECPWRCLMCDLWRNTLTQPVAPGDIPRQIDYALSRLPAARHIKLYNSGSFFDPLAIPASDYKPIAERLSGFDRVIVECHPALVGSQTLQFRDRLAGRLEVAMGLETAHPESLEKLNKRMTLAHFRKSAELLRSYDIALRVFVLIQPPFMSPSDALHWACRSIDFAFDCDAAAVTVIPTRADNGAMEALQNFGDFTAPSLSTVEAVLDYGIGLARCRVFVDLWDIERIPACSECRAKRVQRLGRMNLAQTSLPQVSCELCGGPA